MANRYWVGGAGTWDATTTTNWSATSGGAGGASAPTSVDNVFFNSASNAAAYTVIIGTGAVALDVSIAGPTSGNVTINAPASSVISVYGSWINTATGITFTALSSASVSFLATTTGKTISTNGASWGFLPANFNGVGGGWTLLSAFSSLGTFNINSGTFSTGNFAISTSVFNIGLVSTTRSVSLGSSTITCLTNWDATTTTGLTFVAGTSTINLTSGASEFWGGGLSYNSVTFTALPISTVAVYGSSTFANLSFTSRTTDGLGVITFAGNQTITGTLTLGIANTAVRRLFVQSSIIGTQRTLTVATVAALSDIDFRDIVAAGASGTWSGTRIGNCKNNSNITFTTAKTVYFSSSAGVSAAWASASWATSSGGADFSVNNFPLAQDTVYIDDAGATTGNGLRTSGIITLGASWNIGNFVSTRTNAYSLNQGNNDPVIYGDFTLSSGISFTVLTSPTWTFAGQGVTQNITTAGKTINSTNVTVNSPGGTVKLLDAWTQAIPSGATSASFNLTAGTLDLNGFTLTANTFGNSSSITRTLAFGTTGKLVLFGNAGTIYSGSVSTNLTVTGTAPLVQFTYAGATGNRAIVMSAVTEAQSISVEFLNSATDTVTIQGTLGGYRNINFTSFNGTIATANTPRIYGNVTIGANVINNTLAGTGITFAATSGTKTITSNGIAFATGLTFNGVGGTWQLLDNLTTSTNNILTLTAGTIDLNNNTLSTGKLSSSNTNTRSIAFGSSGKVLLTDNSGTMYNIDTATGYTYTGTNRFEFPNGGSATTRAIYHGITDGTETNAPNIYVTGGADTFSVSGTGRKYGTVNFTGFSGTPEIVGETYIYGNLILSATGLTLTTQTNPIIFAATSGTKYITTNAKVINGPITFDGVGGTWQLLDAFNSGTKAITLTNGTFNTGGMSISSGSFSSSNSNVRTLIIGSGTSWNLNNSGTVWDCTTSTNLTVTVPGLASSYVFLNLSPSTFAGGGKSYPGLGFANMDLTITGANTFYRLINITGANTVKFPPSITTTITDPYSNGQFEGYGVGYELILNSSTPGTQATVAIPNNLQLTKDYMTYQDVNISTQSSLWYAKSNSVIGTNVTGVTTTLGEFLNLF